MASNDGPKKQRQGLKSAVMSIFRSSKTHTGPGPADEAPWTNGAEKPEVLPTIHEAVRDNDVGMALRILQAHPGQLHETDDRK